MASDNEFMKPEVPESVRDLVKASIEQARKAFDTFVTTSEKSWKSFGSSTGASGTGLWSLNEKISDITRKNADANFNLALNLAGARDVSEAIEMQSKHARTQMEAFASQLEEIRDLAAGVIEESSSAAASAASMATPSSPQSHDGNSQARTGTGGQ